MLTSGYDSHRPPIPSPGFSLLLPRQCSAWNFNKRLMNQLWVFFFFFENKFFSVFLLCLFK